MTNKKHNKDNPGQRPLAGFPQEMEAVDKTERPKAMPSLAVLRTEMARMGGVARTKAHSKAELQKWASGAAGPQGLGAKRYAG